MLFYFTRQIAIKTQADSAAGPFVPAFANRKQRTGIDSTSVKIAALGFQRIRVILLDVARTWTRLALEAEQWAQMNRPSARLTKAAPTKRRSSPPNFHLAVGNDSLRNCSGLEPRLERGATSKLIARGTSVAHF